MTGWVDEKLTNQSEKVTFQNEAFEFFLSEPRNYFSLTNTSSRKMICFLRRYFTALNVFLFYCWPHL